MSDEDVVEFEYNEDGEEDLKKTLKKLREDLKEARKQKEEYLTGWQKERADFANYKKDEQARKAAFSEAVQERMLSRFISILDSFNMAMGNRDTWEKVDKNWRMGVEHIATEAKKIFEEFGVKEIGKVGETFDPNIHHSINLVPTEKKEDDHKIAQVVQKGYQMGPRTLRPASVNVFEFKEMV